MKLSEIKNALPYMDNIIFQLENGDLIPEHFHVTEVGMITKNFIDCGGSIRTEKVVNFQLWSANDYDHRLKPIKLLNIIKLSEQKLGIEDLEIEVEYQADTIGKYGLRLSYDTLILTKKQTDCLAKDNCGIPQNELPIKNTTCTPGGGCC
jgi:hypothetical protein